MLSMTRGEDGQDEQTAMGMGGRQMGDVKSG